MGLQTTSTKRKYEIGSCGEIVEIQADCTPSKTSRLSTEAESTSSVATERVTESSSGTSSSVETSISVSATITQQQFRDANVTATIVTTSSASSISLSNSSSENNASNNSSITAFNASNNATNNVRLTSTNKSVATSLSASVSVPSMIPSAEESIAKLEAVAAVEPWGPEPIVDSISRMQAVAVPDTWRSDSTRSTLATTLLSADDLNEDDDDFEDDFDEDESIIPSYSPMRYPCTPPPSHLARGGYMAAGSNYLKPSYYSEPYPQQNCSRTPYSQYGNRSLPMNGHYGWNHHHAYHPSYYGTPTNIIGSTQQTIRCAENGKSYLELGSSNYGANDGRHLKRCCDGRNGIWCNNNKQCYREQRLKIRNLSMFKLSRFRQVSEQSLYRSVLICNTLKFIDREIEAENKETAEYHAHHALHYSAHMKMSNGVISATNGANDPRHHHHSQHHTTAQSQPMHGVTSSPVTQSPTNHAQQQQQQQPPPPMHNTQSPQSQYSSDNSNNSNYTQSAFTNRTSGPTVTSTMPFSETLPPYDHPLRDVHQSGRVTPFPCSGMPDTDSGYGDEDATKPINWGSVLSLSSQSALDPLNNNDLFSTTSTTSCTTASVTSNASSIGSTASSTSITTTTTHFNGTTTVQQPSAQSVSQTSANWDYNLLDMDLGIGPELTELLPSWKLTPLSADDILKSVTTPMEPTKIVLENEMDSLTHIMVGGS